MAEKIINNTIFRRFDEILDDAGKGRKYATHCYMRYIDLFSEEDRKIIDAFRSKSLHQSKDGSATIQTTDLTVMSNCSDSDNAVIDRFVGFAEGLPCCSFTGWVRRLFSRRRAIKMQLIEQKALSGAVSSKSDKPKPMKKTDDFLSNRYQSQQSFFSKNSTRFKEAYHKNQKRIMWISLIISVMSVLSVFVVNVVDYFSVDKALQPLVSNGISVFVAFFSALTAYISSNDKLFQNLDFWVRYRVASESLKSEYALFEGRCGVYDTDDVTAEKKFRENVEAIVQKANDNFVKLLGDNNKAEEPAAKPIETAPSNNTNSSSSEKPKSEPAPEKEPEPTVEDLTIPDAGDGEIMEGPGGFADVPPEEAFEPPVDAVVDDSEFQEEGAIG